MKSWFYCGVAKVRWGSAAFESIGRGADTRARKRLAMDDMW